ncbi:MAG TPA: T9SS type A sorting domain-containing protein [Flavisolibacter sp.]|nr:T9SS type A sorting domain-containing protein [Flavisolibacter sp.]
MKRNILLSLLLASFLCANAQKKQKPVTAYAITALQKGQNNWTEVRLIDINTGEELKTIYQSSQEIERLNARTGKPIAVKEMAKQQTAEEMATIKKEGVRILKRDDGTIVAIFKKNGDEKELVNKIRITGPRVSPDKPFATNSAACAYDKNHQRLYYTPMGISQLRYIDLKSKTPKIYYFEDEAFGPLKNPRDIPNQITRMVIGADGNGYALTNDANHLLQFTTKKKPVITDLGALTDDASNGSFSVHSCGGYGGDMIADASGGFYLVTANRMVFKIDLQTKIATYKGSIKGLPKGYTTNGAIAEGANTVIVNSSNSTQGYYRFDLTNLQAEKVSSSTAVFNASDLANGTLAFEKKRKENRPVNIEPVESLTTAAGDATERKISPQIPGEGTISVYPNPVTNGLVRLQFANQPQGRYQIQLMDIAGKLVSSRSVTVNNKIQVEEFKLPKLLAGGSYLVKVVGENNTVSTSTKIVVQ